uniref:Uncharacterized protein n=1 Tax=Tanacetum cinerariifolium TaxID=118510 RepID=A0A6L2KD96_TANCI|nr:hypothetical protein [Tanacetum cinerariifolium]
MTVRWGYGGGSEEVTRWCRQWYGEMRGRGGVVVLWFVEMEMVGPTRGGGGGDRQHESRRSYRWFYHEDSVTDGEAMINSIKNGDQPLPRVTQVPIAGTSSTEQPPLKDKSMWSD